MTNDGTIYRQDSCDEFLEVPSIYEEPKSYEYYKRINEVERLYSQGLINEQEYRRVIDGIK